MKVEENINNDVQWPLHPREFLPLSQPSVFGLFLLFVVQKLFIQLSDVLQE